jgi:hypothetical protein
MQLDMQLGLVNVELGGLGKCALSVGKSQRAQFHLESRIPPQTDPNQVEAKLMNQKSEVRSQKKRETKDTRTQYLSQANQANFKI